MIRIACEIEMIAQSHDKVWHASITLYFEHEKLCAKSRLFILVNQIFSAFFNLLNNRTNYGL